MQSASLPSRPATVVSSSIWRREVDFSSEYLSYDHDDHDDYNVGNGDKGNGDNEGDDHFAGPQASEAEKRPPGPRVHSPCSRSRGIWRSISVIFDQTGLGEHSGYKIIWEFFPKCELFLAMLKIFG